MEYNAKDKYYDMKRHMRLKKINTDNGNLSQTQTRKTQREDFFNRCYHFQRLVERYFNHYYSRC